MIAARTINFVVNAKRKCNRHEEADKRRHEEKDKHLEIDKQKGQSQTDVKK
jgi:hypothetical protein